MIEELHVREQSSYCVVQRPVGNIEGTDWWFIAACDSRAGEHRWHQLSHVQHQPGSTMLAWMTHLGDGPAGPCLAVFDSNAVVAVFEVPGPSMGVQARRVRAILKRNYPGHQFDVRVEGGRVGTCWTDGPEMDMVARDLMNCGTLVDHRITWRRTQAGIMERRLYELLLGRRREYLPAQVGAGLARVESARSDAASIVNLLRAFGASQGQSIRRVLAETGLAVAASILDVDLDLDLSRNADYMLATLLDAEVLVSAETRRPLPPPQMT